MSNMEIKEIIKNRRIELGLTQLDVAQAVGVSEATVSRWESGDIANMKRSRIAALASILRISPNVIMGWDDTPEPHQATIDATDAQVWEKIKADPRKLQAAMWMADLDSETFSRVDQILTAAFER